ncbi:dienelactone hydrolase [Actinotalea sp. M2MS4P-6]|uniref:alpha/beta hydrolase family protein n=1 Tax=Actinotalea sp. M2MS4P-6 TaxID=2983762 RepID=UPI0021E3CBBF|nr:alpha/beta family hydrolase [Actinotalea sp. M2MS4P-6]MCV2395590.1 dienelactone hydrolase [Actinotalea sp. M2MS4P-6]
MTAAAAGGGRPAGLLLTPGSNGDPDHPPLLAVAEAVERAGVPVRRFGFGSPDKDGRGPAPAATAVARIRAEADRWAGELGVPASRLLLGGRSFGGRMCSVAVAEGQPSAGLVLLSYPLHPPGRPDRLRVEHLPRVRVPVLAVSGATDPYGSPDELAAAFAAVGGPLTHVTVAGPHVPKDAAAVADTVAAWVLTLSS